MSFSWTLLLYCFLVVGTLLSATASEDPGSSSTEQDEETRREYIRQFNDVVENQQGGTGPKKPSLKINEAWFTVNSTVNYDVEIWTQTDECYKCDLMSLGKVPALTARTIILVSSYYNRLQLVRVHPGGNPKHLLCSFHHKFTEAGDYWVFVDFPRPGREADCHLILANDPQVPELPILYTVLGLMLLAIVYILGKKLFVYVRNTVGRRQNAMDITSHDSEGNGSMRFGNGKSSKEDDGTAGTAGKTESELPKARARLRSLDTFRGLTLVLMIFVNYGGGRYWFFEHATWNGIHVADLVFPWFVFIMGVSLTFSFRSMAKKGWSVPQIVKRVVRRSAKLFALGFMSGTVHWIANLPTVRVFGVLQRLALTYLISSLIHFCFIRKEDSHQNKRWAPVRDVLLYLPEWLVNLAIVAIHLGIVHGLPVPGCPTGYVGPGGMSESGKFWNCTGGATQYVDAVILGHDHMYQWPTPRATYKTLVPFDPEGVLGTLSCVFLCFLGIQCGRIFLIFQDSKQRMIRFAVWAAILGALGALLTKCSLDDGWIPANKNIWTLSYTLITGSFGYLLMLGLYFLIDVTGVWQGQPFIYPGMNSIVIYLCHNIFYKMFPVSWMLEEIHWKLLLECVWGTAVWVIVSYWLFLKKIFIAL